MPLYFAFGSNMSPRQMQRRCPGARPVGAGVLAGWRFIILKARGANIIPSPGSAVHGVVWRVTHAHLRLLDLWEGTAIGAYRRRRVTVLLASPDVRLVPTIAYVSDRRWPGFGRPDYLLTAVLPGARAFDLPAAYQDELTAWLGPRPIGPVRTVYRGRRRGRQPSGRGPRTAGEKPANRIIKQ